MTVQLWLECLGAGDALALRAVGSCYALGNWDPSRGASLERCPGEGEGGSGAMRWQLAGGPLALTDIPNNTPCKLEYRYMMLRGDRPGEYQWEDIGSMEVPLFSARSGLSAQRRFCVRPLNRCLVLPKGGRALLARRDRWGSSCEGCGEEGAWREQRVCRVPADFSVVGGARTFGPGGKEEEPGDVGTRAREQLVLARRTRLLGCLRQLTRQAAERGSAPGDIWMHVGQFLGEA